MTVDPRQQRSRKPEGGELSAMVPMRLRRSPVRGDGSWRFDLAGSLPRSIGQLAVAAGPFALAGIRIRPHPQDRLLAPPVPARLLTGRQASLDATSVDRADRSTSAAVGEGATARLKSRLVTLSEGGGPSGP
ncbi:hypothetical protein [Streptomyces cacaoi]|uniref:hypothetical protein n=1 Tax=Streptomyces cacaoi TaxID=1898 RepID=UPI003747C6C7